MFQTMDKEEYKRKMQEKYEQQVRENAELLKKEKKNKMIY